MELKSAFRPLAPFVVVRRPWVVQALLPVTRTLPHVSTTLAHFWADRVVARLAGIWIDYRIPTS